MRFTLLDGRATVIDNQVWTVALVKRADVPDGAPGSIALRFTGQTAEGMHIDGARCMATAAGIRGCDVPEGARRAALALLGDNGIGLDGRPAPELPDVDELGAAY